MPPPHMGVTLFKQALPHFGQQVEKGRLLIPARLEERGNMLFRGDQGVAGRDGETVVDGDGVVVGGEDPGFSRVAERAVGLIVNIFLH